MEPTETLTPESGDLEKTRLREIVTRLEAVRRRCAEARGSAGRQNKAQEGLDTVIDDLDNSLGSGSEPMTIDELDLRLATVEEMFEVTGSHGLGQVLASIRNSLAIATEEASLDEEPPPPRRFQPSPTSAVRRRRPKPKTRKKAAPAPVPTRKGRFGWLKVLIVIAVAAAGAWFVYLRPVEPEITPPDPPDRVVSYEPVFSSTSPSAPPITARNLSGADGEFDPHEEDMAHFTLEISLAESALQDGDLNGSLRHFAAAAAIDRQNRRVVRMGKSLIAAMLQEADAAYDRGGSELAEKRVQSARSIARGLQLAGSSNDNNVSQGASTTHIEDITLQGGVALGQAVGHTVRLTLKTRDVVRGHIIEIQDNILILDAYSGTRSSGAESSTSILASTIKDIRVYDAR